MLPGALIVSMKYFSNARPLIYLKNDGSPCSIAGLRVELLELNHSIVGKDGTVSTELLQSWTSVQVRTVCVIP